METKAKVDFLGAKIPFQMFLVGLAGTAIGATWMLFRGNLAIGAGLAATAGYGGFRAYKANELSNIVDQDVKDESRARRQVNPDRGGVYQVDFSKGAPKSRKVMGPRHADLLGRGTG